MLTCWQAPRSEWNSCLKTFQNESSQSKDKTRSYCYPFSFKYLDLSTLSKFVFKCHISLDNQDISTLWFDQRGSQYYISPLLAELLLSKTCSWHIHQWMDRGKLEISYAHLALSTIHRPAAMMDGLFQSESHLLFVYSASRGGDFQFSSNNSCSLFPTFATKGYKNTLKMSCSPIVSNWNSFPIESSGF